jgi:hypothetical protein
MYYPCIVHVSCMYRACISMCPVHIYIYTSININKHQYTSRYNKIHLQKLHLSLWLSYEGYTHH